MNWVCLFLCLLFCWILFQVTAERSKYRKTKEGFNEPDTSCTTQNMQASITANANNITALQNQVDALQSTVSDLSGNLSNLNDEVNTMQSQQASIVSSTSPVSVSGADYQSSS